jgi:Flp pilus assembly protein TadB
MSAQVQQLLALFESLAPGEQASLLAFAEFLAARGKPAPPPVTRAIAPLPEPEAIERQPGESIVAGLKRLSKTYPMLDKSEMLSATSDIVATNIMQGGDAAQVIDELEEIFATHYRQLKARHKGE